MCFFMFSDGSCVFVHAFVFCIISLARFSFWMCLHLFQIIFIFLLMHWCCTSPVCIDLVSFSNGFQVFWDAFVFPFVLLAPMFSKCDSICAFKWVPCFLDVCVFHLFFLFIPALLRRAHCCYSSPLLENSLSPLTSLR